MQTTEFKSITPYIQPLQKQGSFYTFSSAAEDFTTTMSEVSDVKFRFSKYALIKIPDLVENYNIISNTTKLNAIPGVFINQFDGYSKNELFSEIFENYCLNFENGLLSQDTYDNRELKTVAERVFFKFLVDVTALRFEDDVIQDEEYVEEENAENVYERVIKAIGEITASSVSKNSDSTYTTAYVHVADVNGTSEKVLFTSNFDINYPAEGIIERNDPNNQLNNEIIFGRQYTDEHPFGLDIRAIYDNDDGFSTFPPTPSDASIYPNVENGIYTFSKKELYDPELTPVTEPIAIPNGSEWVGNWNINTVWYGTYPYINSNLNSYRIRKEISYDNELQNTDYGLYKGNLNDLKDLTSSSPEIYYDTLLTKFRKTNLDGIEIDWNLSHYGEYESFNELAQTENSESYDFNAVLLYYDLYEDAKDSNGNIIYETLPSGIKIPKVNVLATNLFGIQFLSDVESDANGAKIECFKKVKANSSLLESGTEYGLSLNFKISTNTGGVTVTQVPVIAENNTIAMGMYIDLLEKQMKANDIISTMQSSILEIVNNTTNYLNLQKTATYDYVTLSNRVQDLEVAIANSQNTALLNSLTELLPLYQELNENVRNIIQGNITPKLAVDTSLITQGNNIQIKKYANSSIEISSKSNDFTYYGNSIFTQNNFILKTGANASENVFTFERKLTIGNNYIRFQNKEYGNDFECPLQLKFYINIIEKKFEDGQTFTIYFQDMIKLINNSNFEIYIMSAKENKLIYNTTNIPKEIRIHKNNNYYFVDTFEK